MQERSLSESYDVYVDDHKPLTEGEEKHVISVFVADESGLINRVTGVFGRRGARARLPGPPRALAWATSSWAGPACLHGA